MSIKHIEEARKCIAHYYNGDGRFLHSRTSSTFVLETLAKHFGDENEHLIADFLDSLADHQTDGEA